MKAIDIHAHIFSEVNGKGQYGRVVSDEFGMVRNAGALQPFIPPLCQKTMFTIENLLRLMEQSNVKKAVLVQNPTIGTVNDEIARALQQYPDVLRGAIQIDPFAENAVVQLRNYADMGVFSALKLEMSDDWGWLAVHKRDEFHYCELYSLMDIVAEYGLAVILDTGAVGGRAYLPDELQKLARDYVSTSIIIEHQGYFTNGADDTLWEDMVLIGENSNVYFGISAAGQLLEEEYPCKRALGNLERAYSMIGAKKLLWGTDCPTTLRRYTYLQMKDMIVEHTPFLSCDERADILYNNADRLFFSDHLNR